MKPRRYVLKCADCGAESGALVRGVLGRHPDTVLCLRCYGVWVDDHLRLAPEAVGK